jgi:type VI secretion system protein ImpG
MTDIRRFFEQEIMALREEGGDFAKAFPEAARYLDSPSIEDRDPYVERLTEGVAFLTSRIREMQQAEHDGLTRHLLEIVAPDLDQPLPSVVVVQFGVRSDFAEPTTLPAGTTVVAAGGHATSPSPFRFVGPVAIEQVDLRAARVETTDANKSVLEWEFVKSSQDKDRAWPEALSVFLLGDAPVVWAMRFALLHRLAKIEVFREGSWEAGPEFSVSRLDLPGYTAERSIPSPLANARDFLCADERFRFVKIAGFPQGLAPQNIRLRIHFEGSLPRGMARGVSKDLFRLNTGVAVNRFVESCQALGWDHTQATMVLRAQGGVQREILDVVAVEGSTTSHPPRRIAYRKFSSYRHGAMVPHFQMVREHDRNGRAVVGLALGTDGSEGPLENQYLSIQAICSDGDHPHDRLQSLTFKDLAMENPPRVSVLGLTRPTQSFRPPPQADPRSRLLAFASGHFEGWLHPGRIKDALRHVMWDPSESKRTLIEAIQDVSVEHGHALVEGVAWRTMTATIRMRDTTCTPDTWDRLGVIDAFGSALFKIVQDETSIGSRTRMRIVVEPAGVELEWKE